MKLLERLFANPKKGKIPKKEVIDVLSHWDLGKVKSIQMFKFGGENLNYGVVTTKGKFVLREVKHYLFNKSKKYLLGELEIVNNLPKKIPVPRAIKSKDGDYILQFKDTFAIVFPWMQGKHYSDITFSKAKNIGEIMGEFHNAGKNISFSKSFKQTRDNPTWPKVKKAILDHQKKLNKKQKEYILPELKKVKETNFGNLPQGFVHGDLTFDNMLFKGNKVSAILDFDDSFYGPLILDIARCIFGFGLDKPNQKKNISALLKGYESRRKLSKQEKSLLFPAVQFFLMAYWGYNLMHAKAKGSKRNPFLDLNIKRYKRLLSLGEAKFKALIG